MQSDIKFFQSFSDGFQIDLQGALRDGHLIAKRRDAERFLFQRIEETEFPEYVGASFVRCIEFLFFIQQRYEGMGGIETISFVGSQDDFFLIVLIDLPHIITYRAGRCVQIRGQFVCGYVAVACR